MAKVPGPNALWYLFTGKTGNIYYNVVDMSIPGGQVLSPFNRQVTISGGNLSYESTMKQFSFAVYNDLRTGGKTKLYVAVNNGNMANLYSLDIVDNSANNNTLANAGLVKQFSDELCTPLECTTLPGGGVICSQGSCIPNQIAQIDLGEMHISPQGTKLALKLSRGRGAQIKHRIEFFDIHATTLALSNNTSQELASEARPKPGTYAQFRSRLKFNTLSFDYSPGSGYVYYVQDNSSGSIFALHTDFKRMQVSSGTVQTIVNMGRQAAPLKSEVRRAANGNLYINSFELKNVVQCPPPFNCPVPAPVSELLVYTNLDATPSVATALQLNSGNNNFALPWQPYRKYPVSVAVNAYYSEREINDRLYEFADHLGNVRAVLADVRRWHDADADDALDEGENVTVVKSWTDYSAFGAQLVGRVFAMDDYRYGFNGQEKDKDVVNGNIYCYEYRSADVKLGRFWSVDPLSAKYPYNSSYAFAENRVIDGVELEGLEWAPYDASGNRLDISSEGWESSVSEYRWEGYDLSTTFEYGGVQYSSYSEAMNAVPGFQKGNALINTNVSFTPKAGTVSGGSVTTSFIEDGLTFSTTVNYSTAGNSPRIGRTYSDPTRFSEAEYLLYQTYIDGNAAKETFAGPPPYTGAGYGYGPLNMHDCLTAVNRSLDALYNTNIPLWDMSPDKSGATMFHQMNILHSQGWASTRVGFDDYDLRAKIRFNYPGYYFFPFALNRGYHSEMIVLRLNTTGDVHYKVIDQHGSVLGDWQWTCYICVDTKLRSN